MRMCICLLFLFALLLLLPLATESKQHYLAVEMKDCSFLKLKLKQVKVPRKKSKPNTSPTNNYLFMQLSHFEAIEHT